MTLYTHAISMITGYSIVAGEAWTPERERSVHAEELAHAKSRERDASRRAPRPLAMDSVKPPEIPPKFQGFHPPTGRILHAHFHAPTARALEAACGPNLPKAPFASPRTRAELLEAIARELESNQATVLGVASRETGLTRARLRREFARMVGTLRLFASLVLDGSWVRASIDHASAQSIGPGHDVRRMLVPLGTVAVFPASNFPLAYGVAGGDTASALAAGCPVVVKGHPAHPATGEFIAWCVVRAIRSLELPAELFAFLHGGGPDAYALGTRLIDSPWIHAVGFTGSFAGGKALIDAANARHRPVPVFAEMGSANPVFIFPHAAAQRMESICDELARSILDSSGQQCTCPTLVFVPTGDGFSQKFIELMGARFDRWKPKAMLSKSIAAKYHDRVRQESQSIHNYRDGATPIARVSSRHSRGSQSSDNAAFVAPVIFRICDTEFEYHRVDEIFGPAIVVVESGGDTPFLAATLAWSLDPHLVASLYFDPRDALPDQLGCNQVAEMIHELSVLSGRLVFNGPPTGVRVCNSMVHAGPFPATNRPDSTAVGPLAIERWCRPVCFQNCPHDLLPPELQDHNPRNITRTIDGKLVPPAHGGVSRT